MNDAAHRRSRAILAALAALATLPGCLTSALWSTDEPTPRLHTVTVPCRVSSIAGRLVPDGDLPPELEVRFAPAVERPVPRHLERFTEDRPATIVLRPVAGPLGGSPWPRTAAPPSSWHMRVVDGTYLRRSTMNVEVVMQGSVEVAMVGSLLSADLVPARLRHAAPIAGVLPGGWLDRALRGLSAQRWERLLADDRSGETTRRVPIAWLGPGDRELADDDMRAIVLGTGSDEGASSLAACRLLARIERDGAPASFLTIPVPVLLHAADMRLARRGDRIVYARAQSWRAEFGAKSIDDVGRTTLPPLPAGMFAYQWSTEIREPWLVATLARAAATPFALALDLVVTSNPTLRILYALIMGEPIDFVRSPRSR